MYIIIIDKENSYDQYLSQIECMISHIYICMLFAGREVRPRPANNMFMFFSLDNYFIQNICVDFFTEAVSHRFGQANPCCLQSI